jgi:hypothetical protein
MGRLFEHQDAPCAAWNYDRNDGANDGGYVDAVEVTRAPAKITPKFAITSFAEHIGRLHVCSAIAFFRDQDKTRHVGNQCNCAHAHHQFRRMLADEHALRDHLGKSFEYPDHLQPTRAARGWRPKVFRQPCLGDGISPPANTGAISTRTIVAYVRLRQGS